MRISARLVSTAAVLLGAQLCLAHAQTATTAGSPDIRPGHIPGEGTSYPLSPDASNITSSDAKSPIAPTAPPPAVGPNATVQQLLASADQSLSAGQTGTANAALEDAETRILTRSVPQGTQNMPSSDPLISQIEQARQALASNNKSSATQQINQILSSNAPELSD